MGDTKESSPSLDSIAQLIRERRGTEQFQAFAEMLNESLSAHAAESASLDDACTEWAGENNSSSSVDERLVGRFEFAADRISTWEKKGISEFDYVIVFLCRAMNIPLPEVFRRYFHALLSVQSHLGRPVERVRDTIRQLLCPSPLGQPCLVLAARVVARDRVGVVYDIARAIANLDYNIVSMAQGSAPGASLFVTTYVIEVRGPVGDREMMLETGPIQVPSLLESWSAIEAQLVRLIDEEACRPYVLAFPLVGLVPSDVVANLGPSSERQGNWSADGTVGEFLCNRFAGKKAWAPKLVEDLLLHYRHHTVAAETLQRWAVPTPAGRQVPEVNDLTLEILEYLGVPRFRAVAMMLRSRLMYNHAHSEVSRFLDLVCNRTNEDVPAWSLWVKAWLPDRPGLLADLTDPVRSACYSIVHVAQCSRGKMIVIFMQLRCAERSARLSAVTMRQRLVDRLGLGAAGNSAESTVEVRSLGVHDDGFFDDRAGLR